MWLLHIGDHTGFSLRQLATHVLEPDHLRLQPSPFWLASALTAMAAASRRAFGSKVIAAHDPWRNHYG